MSSEARIFIFNHRVYQDKILPAFHRLLWDGALEFWLRELYNRLIKQGLISLLPRVKGVDIGKFCHYLDTNFAYLGRRKDLLTSSWKYRACYSKDCEIRYLCPFHAVNGGSGEARKINFLFEAAIVNECLGDSQFLGRSVSPTIYKIMLSRSVADPIPELFRYFDLLEYRGFVIGCQFLIEGGIYGWLTETETVALCDKLDTLDLPEFEHDFSKLSEFVVMSKNGLMIQPPPGYSFEQTSLAFLGVAARMAYVEDMGILWGNDILTLW